MQRPRHDPMGRQAIILGTRLHSPGCCPSMDPISRRLANPIKGISLTGCAGCQVLPVFHRRNFPAKTPNPRATSGLIPTSILFHLDYIAKSEHQLPRKPVLPPAPV